MHQQSMSNTQRVMQAYTDTKILECSSFEGDKIMWLKYSFRVQRLFITLLLQLCFIHGNCSWKRSFHIFLSFFEENWTFKTQITILVGKESFQHDGRTTGFRSWRMWNTFHFRNHEGNSFGKLCTIGSHMWHWKFAIKRWGHRACFRPTCW